MKRITIAFIAVVALVATRARADEASGPSLGLRAAYALPFGSAGNGTDLARLTSGAIPMQLDVGYRFDRHWEAGAYFGWGPAGIADEAKAALAASGATGIGGHALMRLGVQGTYTFLPEARFAPWIGLSAGYEWARYASATVSGKDSEIGLRGFEAAIQVGGHYRVSSRFAVGPFASLNVGQFQSSMTSVSGSGETSADVADKGIHEWLQLGIRGTFSL